MGLLKPLILDPRQKVRLTKISIWDFYLDSSYLCKITVGFEIWRQASQQPAKTSIWSSVCRSIMILITCILCHTIHFIHKLRHCIFHPILIHKYLLLKISCLLYKHNQRTWKGRIRQLLWNFLLHVWGLQRFWNMKKWCLHWKWETPFKNIFLNSNNMINSKDKNVLEQTGSL